MDLDVGLSKFKELGVSDKIDWYKKPLFEKKYYVPFTRASNYPNLEVISQQFNDELKKMKADGRYQKVVERWFGEN